MLTAIESTAYKLLCIRCVVGGILTALLCADSNLLLAQSVPSAAQSRSHQLNERGVASMNSNDLTKAEDLFRQAVDADYGNVSAAYNLGGTLVLNKKQHEAIGFLNKYTAQYDKDAGLFVVLGDAHFSLKEIPQALKAYEKAWGLDQNYKGLASKLGTIYGLQNRLGDAEDKFRAATSKDPKDYKSMTNLANILLAQGKADQAIATAKRALQIKASKELYVTLGSAYEMQSDLKNALISFQRAIDLGDEREEVKQKVTALKEITAKSSAAAS